MVNDSMRFMMRRKPFLIHVISLLLALSVLFFASAFTAYAVGEDGEPDGAQVYEEPAEYPQDTPVQEPQETPQEEPQQDIPAEEPQQEPAQEEPAQEEPSYTPIYEYIYGYGEDMISEYVEPEYLGELPEVSAGEVVEATAVVIPEVAVSDASMLSGIVMWLCVALGIAVIVGVLVSKRTRRRGV